MQAITSGESDLQSNIRSTKIPAFDPMVLRQEVVNQAPEGHTSIIHKHLLYWKQHGKDEKIPEFQT